MRRALPQEGTGRGVEALLARYVTRLRAFVRLNAGARLRAKEAESDLVQSVCREVLEQGAGIEFDSEAAFKAWLFQAARHKIIDRARYWRRAKRAVSREVAAGAGSASAGSRELLTCYATFSTPSAHAIANEQQARIEQAFARLTPRQRRVITLARIVGLPHATIGKELGLEQNAVRQLLFRSLARFSTLLGKEDQRASD